MPIRFFVQNHVGIIILDRPPVNALDREHQTLLQSVAEQAAARPEVRAVMLCSAIGIFSAGADIREMSSMPAQEMRDHAPLLQRAFMAVAEIPKPVGAAIEGYALGGGMELALAADFRISAENVSFALPEISLGVIPGAGGTQRLTRLIGPARANFAVMTGERIHSTEAERLGLVNRVVPPGEAITYTLHLMERLARGPTTALVAAKRAINAATPVDGFQTETRLFAELFGTPDQVEGMAAFVEKREPRFH
jgi:enoyl-CoA hydratase/carnithine racemase